MSGTRNSGTCNMWRPWPYLTTEQIDNSPSSVAYPQMPPKQERKIRNTWLGVIKEAGSLLSQDMSILATAQMYFVRFYAIKSFQQNDGFLLATAALFVACKTEMRPRPLSHVMYHMWRSWIDAWVKQQKRLDKAKVYSEQHWQQLTAREKAFYKDKEWYQEVYDQICSAERALLYATGFQFNVYSAFHALMVIKNTLEKHPNQDTRSFFSKINIQGVWNFGVDVYTSTRLCLQYDPRTIAIACYECGGFCQMVKNPEFTGKFPDVDGDVWWKYAARNATPPWTEDIADPVGVLVILKELQPLYGSMNAASDGDTAIGRFVKQKEALLVDIAQPPLPAGASTSPRFGLGNAVSGPSPGQTSSQTYDESFTASSRTPHYDERSPPPLPTSIQDNQHLGLAAAVPAIGHKPGVSLKRNRAPDDLQDAQKRSKVEEDIFFAPSDEFSISPVRQKDAANGGNLLETQESGEILLEENPAPLKPQDPDVLRARREKARMMLGQKLDTPSSRTEPSQEKPPEPLLDEFDVHFSP